MRTPLRDSLIQVGQRHGYLYPWHKTEDPFEVLVAEYLLRRTTRTVVERVFPRVLAKYPTADELAAADPDELYALAREAGLEQRTKRLVQVSQELAAAGGPRADREALMGLPSVGGYIADATLLYAFGEAAFPLDSSVQRVLHRAALGVHAPPRRDPYKDEPLLAVVEELTVGLSVSETRDLHQGVLYVAWTTCRPTPDINNCSVQGHCVLASLRPGLT